MTPTSRRRFLFSSLGGACALGVGGSLWLARDGGTKRQPGEEFDALQQAFTRSSHALGTSVTITALADDESIAGKALAAAFAAIERVEELMSIYRPGSRLSRLNETGALDDPPAELVRVLQAAQRLSRKSGGAFDVTVQPLWRAYAEADRQGRLPGMESVAAARELVDYRQLAVLVSRIEFRRPGMAVTLNGIAQGYAADQAAQALRQNGVRRAMIDAGEIGAMGRRPDDAPWRIGIQHPRQPDAYISLADLADRSLATSGDYATRFAADERYNHLFDPRTGRSPDELAAVSVAAPNAMTADALSTALFVLGPDAGRALIESSPGCDALFVTKEGRLLATNGFPLVRGEA